MCLTSIAYESDEVSLEEIISNGTLVASDTIQTDEGTFLMETYEYTEKVQDTRSTEQEYVKTVVSVHTPLDTQRIYVPGYGEGAVWLKAHYITKSSATAEEYSDMEGYRLTRVTGYVEENGVIEYNVDFDLLTAYCMDPKSRDDVSVQSFDLTGEEINFVRYPSYTAYVANVAEAKLGASLDYNLYGNSYTINAFLFGAPL